MSNHAQVTAPHMVDSDQAPKLPKGSSWAVKVHRAGGLIDPRRIKTASCTLSAKRPSIGGEEMMQALQQFHPLNATVLDYFLEHTTEIPWFATRIFFPGTIYHNTLEDGGDYIRYLEYSGLKANEGVLWIKQLFQASWQIALK